MIPLLVMWARMPQHRANGTSLLAIAPIALLGALVYYFQGSRPQVDLGFAILLTIGSALGAYLGARAMSRIPDRELAIGMAVVLVLIGLKELVLP
jgi:uncharacterized protein